MPYGTAHAFIEQPRIVWGQAVERAVVIISRSATIDAVIFVAFTSHQDGRHAYAVHSRGHDEGPLSFTVPVSDHTEAHFHEDVHSIERLNSFTDFWMWVHASALDGSLPIAAEPYDYARPRFTVIDGGLS